MTAVVIALLGFLILGIVMIVAPLIGKVYLPDKDRWYSGLYRPGKGSEGVIVLLG
jgi:hypothetical protein